MTREDAKVILALMAREQELSVNNDKSNFEALNMAIQALEQEPKTRHWVLISNKEMEQDLFGIFYANNAYMNYKCSGCGFIVHNALQGRTENRTQYCPNCGSRMMESEE